MMTDEEIEKFIASLKNELEERRKTRLEEEKKKDDYVKIKASDIINKDFLKDTYTNSEDFLMQKYVALLCDGIEDGDTLKAVEKTKEYKAFRKYFESKKTFNTFVKYCKIGDLQKAKYSKSIDEFLDKLYEFEDYKKIVFGNNLNNELSKAKPSEIKEFEYSNGKVVEDLEETVNFRYKLVKFYYSIKGFFKTKKMKKGIYYVTKHFKNSRFMFVEKNKFYEAYAANCMYVTITGQQERIFPYWKIGILDFKLSGEC